MSTHPVDVSVIVPAYNDCVRLARLLESFENLREAPRPEVIVVDDASTDGTEIMVRQWIARGTPFPVRLVRLDANGGPGKARNAGLQAARARVVAFTDSDCVATPDWLAELVAPLDPENRIGGVAGRVEALSDRTLIARYNVVNLSLEPQPSPTHHREPSYLVTCNCCYLREPLLEAGGFTEDIRTPGGEDIAASILLWKQGWRFAYAENAVVRHDFKASILRFMKTFRNYGYGTSLVLHRLLTEEEFHPEWNRRGMDNYWDARCLTPTVTGVRSMLRDLFNFVTCARSRGVSWPRALECVFPRALDRISHYYGWRQGEARHQSEHGGTEGMPRNRMAPICESGDSRIARLSRWEKGETPGPWDLVLFPTNRCNQRCRICWQRWAEAEFGGIDHANECTDDRLLALVDEAAELGVREWNIVGGGEPMIRGALVMRLCERIVARGMTGVLHTNGMLFERAHIELLARIGWGRIGFSLDGPDAATNDAIRTEGSFERATDNLALLASIKAELGVDRPAVSIHSVITTTNFDHLEGIVGIAKEFNAILGLSVLLLHNEDTYRLRLTDEQEARLPERLVEVMAVAKRLGVECNADSLLPGRCLADMGASEMVGDGRLSDALCFEPWLSMVVIADGKVGPCCVFYGEEAETMHDRTLSEVWLGPYFRELRDRLRTRTRIPSYCGNCASHNVARTADLRRALVACNATRWRDMPTHRRVAALAAQTVRSLRSRGLRQTIQRAREWTRMYRS